MPLPSIQVNVFDRQINIAAGALTAAMEQVLELSSGMAGMKVLEAN